VECGHHGCQPPRAARSAAVKVIRAWPRNHQRADGRLRCRCATAARLAWAPWPRRCVSIFLDKNIRYIGKSQSNRPPKRTQRPPGVATAAPRAVFCSASCCWWPAAAAIRLGTPQQPSARLRRKVGVAPMAMLWHRATSCSDPARWCWCRAAAAAAAVGVTSVRASDAPVSDALGNQPSTGSRASCLMRCPAYCSCEAASSSTEPGPALPHATVAAGGSPAWPSRWPLTFAITWLTAR
jgi:hypothetical protein